MYDQDFKAVTGNRRTEELSPESSSGTGTRSVVLEEAHEAGSKREALRQIPDYMRPRVSKAKANVVPSTADSQGGFAPVA